ncbi:nucleotidyltransferase domain-containing protein [Geobacter sp.]|uniref:type VII toxin-antitoxin system MntA family adenylyltransferase antitoxin n=1 Tax=Geobacter sp. TaxID=46610 RepID=UPI00262440C9|nr:nucleotidyltransferase domain-containing protein [Geobacter sp.]
MSMNPQEAIIRTVLEHCPDVQAIYLFGSFGTEDEWPDSDVDIAMLLPPKEAKKAGLLAMSALQRALEKLLKREIDLINLRQVPTVLQKEVIAADRRIYDGDRIAAEEFEMLTLSLYQKLNEERAEIIASALTDGRFHDI